MPGHRRPGHGWRTGPAREQAPRLLPSTVTRIAGIRGLRNLVAADLARRGVLQESKQQVLALFQRRVYPTLDPQPERALVARIRQTLEGSADPDARMAALVGLAEATNYCRRHLRLAGSAAGCAGGQSRARGRCGEQGGTRCHPGHDRGDGGGSSGPQ